VHKSRAAAKYDRLIPVEREVLHLCAEGHSSVAIATKLPLSVRAVETHHANVMHKLGLPTETELVRYVLRRRILSET
jgi:DNA-binding CsgD family transcriptional regulator